MLFESPGFSRGFCCQFKTLSSSPFKQHNSCLISSHFVGPYYKLRQIRHTVFNTHLSDCISYSSFLFSFGEWIIFHPSKTFAYPSVEVCKWCFPNLLVIVKGYLNIGPAVRQYQSLARNVCGSCIPALKAVALVAAQLPKRILGCLRVRTIS
jgi:hypothetical protein